MTINAELEPPSFELLELMKSTCEKEAQQAELQKLQAQLHSKPYVPHGSYHLARWAFGVFVIAVVTIYLLHSPTAEVRVGRIVPVHRQTLKAPFSGHFKANPSLTVGDSVYAGQELGVLENRALNDDLVEARADQLAAEAGLETIRKIVSSYSRELAAGRQLMGEKIMSGRELERMETVHREATYRLTTMEAKIERARTTVERLTQRLELQHVRSPRDGVLLFVRDEFNDAFVDEGMQLFQVGSRKLQVELRADEEVLYGNCSEGDDIMIELPASGHRYRGIIAKIFPQIHDHEVGPYQKEEPYGVILVNPTEELPSSVRPGMHARASLVRSESRMALFWLNTSKLARSF